MIYQMIAMELLPSGISTIKLLPHPPQGTPSARTPPTELLPDGIPPKMGLLLK